ncbi:MAG: hypothetical protein R3B93_12385 [Bacteroidia bacterium]
MIYTPMPAFCRHYAYHLDRNDAVALIEKYIADFDENTKVDLMRYYLGKYYFIRKKIRYGDRPFKKLMFLVA